ncbi:uncharacterized protein [Argopecten irradians]|uniref:uncharacterized protein n=1 Tax=Argopecten irradians TaxID=31199 RepID=UPI00371A32EB
MRRGIPAFPFTNLTGEEYQKGKMPHIPIRNAEDKDPDATVIYFPIPNDGKLTLDDLRTAFPSLVSLRYVDSAEEKQHHILCRDSIFVEPEGGWTYEGRLYLSVCGTDVGNARFGLFQSYRRQITTRPTQQQSAASSNSKKEKSTEGVMTMMTIGHGHFKRGTFSKISATSLSGCGGIVVVGPFNKTGDTSEEIKTAAFDKFRQQNRYFRNKYKKVTQFHLVYPDGSVVKQLPDNSAAFSILAYRNYVDPQKRFDRLRLYLCEKSNYDYEILTDTSTDEELPQLSTPVRNPVRPRTSTPVNDDTLPLLLTVTFHKDDGGEFSEIFPNNAKGSALVECIQRRTGLSDFWLETPEHKIINHDDRMLEITSSDLNVYIHCHQISGETDMVNTEEAQPISGSYEDRDNLEVVDSIIEKTLKETKDTSDPLEILKHFNKTFLTGRPLDVIREDEALEGETTSIYISRGNLFKDTCEELLVQDNIRNPLEVNFHGECALDYGGPRREFLTAFLNEFKLNMCHEQDGYIVLKYNEEYLAMRRYFTAGIIVGLSAIEGGPVSDCLDSVVSRSHGEIATQFIAGLNKTGIAQLMAAKSIVRYLFRPQVSPTVTINKFLHLFKTTFADEGGNRRVREEASYRNFVRYVREAYAGRRGDVKINSILKFATGSSEIPLLGLTPTPTIHFTEDAVFPTASSCINRLYLPISPDDEKYDLAFLSDFFGIQ